MSTRRSLQMLVIQSAALCILIIGTCWFLGRKRPIPPDATPIAHEGDTIVLAMQRYENEVGLWPERLEDLQPKYLKDVPLDWEYRYCPGEDSSWRLSRRSASGEKVWFDSFAKRWKVGLGGRGDRWLDDCPSPRLPTQD